MSDRDITVFSWFFAVCLIIALYGRARDERLKQPPVMIPMQHWNPGVYGVDREVFEHTQEVHPYDLFSWNWFLGPMPLLVSFEYHTLRSTNMFALPMSLDHGIYRVQGAEVPTWETVDLEKVQWWDYGEERIPMIHARIGGVK